MDRTCQFKESCGLEYTLCMARGWHEKCGGGHNYSHDIDNSINENAKCIIDWPTFGLCCYATTK